MMLMRHLTRGKTPDSEEHRKLAFVLPQVDLQALQ